MELKVISTEGLTHIALVGRLDAAAADEISIKFTSQIETRRQPSIVDMSGVDFIASLGLRLLTSAQRTLGRYDTKLVILAPSEGVHNILDQSGLLELLPIAQTEEEARQILGL